MIWWSLYAIIGVIVFGCIVYRVSYHLANLQSGYMSGHPVSHFVDRGNKPGIVSYCFGAFYAAQFAAVWPLVIL